MFGKIIKAVSPKFYLERLRAQKEIDMLEVKNLGYDQNGTEDMRFFTSNDSPDNDILDNLEDLRAKSRELYMSNDIAVAVMDKYRTKVVSVGLIPKPTIDYKYLGITKEKAQEYAKIIETKFEAWAISTNCDATRVHDFFTLQGLVQLSWVMNGDVFAIVKRKPTKDIDVELCVQLIESDRVQSPIGNDEIKGGIEFKKDELYKYYISSKHPGDGDSSINGYPVFNSLGRRNILHIFEPSRVGQKRGIPLLAPILSTYKQLERYKNAELMAAVLNASIALILNSKNPQKTLNGDYLSYASGLSSKKGATPGQQNATYESVKKEMVATMGHGTVFTSTDGDEIKEFQTTRPSKSYKDFVDNILEEMGAASGVPKEVMMSAFKSSYSAAKASLEEAESRFKVCRKILERKFCHPIYEEFIIELIKNGDVECPDFFTDTTVRYAFSKCAWIGSSKPSLDPLKDAKTAEVLINNKILPRSYIVAGMGHDPDSTKEQIMQETIEIAELQAKVNKQLKKGGETNGQQQK